ncbi:SRPBCC family protein [Nonomuraea sp. NBC_01738]|uniref:SRPBCC family protein n=1 Tax=Nonomuraea sp. NBC_01738 TaxID=2976003 RepID=UPI002E15592F|nr:SRPBCC family protein [Nonomuraea sp. NBC_01738]
MMILQARAQAPLAAVHHALTDPESLRVWLAEHAEVELPHRFEFWGRFTPEGDEPHQRLLHSAPDALRFTWFLDGVETTTEITLTAESADTTLVRLAQSHFDYELCLEGKSIRGALETYWCLSLANLVDFVEGREITTLVDFTSPDMSAEVFLDASPAEVFESLIDSAAVSRWFGYPIEIEPHVGGRYAMGGLAANPDPAKIIDLTPATRLTVDWGGGMGTATWELAESGGRTRLTMVQSGFDTGNPPYAAWCGNLSGLSELRRFHDLTPWAPIWVPEEAGAPA